VEAVRRAPFENRGLAIEAYAACLEMALGIASPVLGLIASGAGLNAVFLVVFCAAGVATSLLRAARQKPMEGRNETARSNVSLALLDRRSFGSRGKDSD
jgi:hypothetical protein